MVLAPCSRCGNALATEDGLVGLCPACAFALALDVEDESGGARAWLRRHRIGLGVGIAALVAAGALIASIHARSARIENVERLESRIALGCQHCDQGRFREAETVLRASLPDAERNLGPDNRATLRAIQGLGAAILEQGRAREAESLFRDALARRRRVLGPDHPDTLETMASLARACESLDRPTEAELLRREVREIGARKSAQRTD